jgi:hypothetical protein
VRRPRLPEWLTQVTVLALRVGDASVDLRFMRKPDGARVDVGADVREGELRVEVGEAEPSSGA